MTGPVIDTGPGDGDARDPAGPLRADGVRSGRAGDDAERAAPEGVPDVPLGTGDAVERAGPALGTGDDAGRAAPEGVPDVPVPVDRAGQVDLDALAVLEDERDFLLRSLDDLEREHDAGDVDDVDYETLRDDYTARAAAVIRAIESGRARFSAARPARSWGRTMAWIAGIVAFAVLAGVLVTQATGRRDPGGFITGDVRRAATENLNRAGVALQEGRYDDAIDLYDAVLVERPADHEALTYRGWAQVLGGDRQAGLLSLIEAATVAPDYPDVHAFLAVVFLRSGLVDEAERELDLLEGLDPPAGVRALVAPLRDQIEAVRTGDPAPPDGGASSEAPEPGG